MNGTVTDTVTGLVWLRDLSCFATAKPYDQANQAAAALANGQCGLTDHSVASDWRLPTKDEWSATVARAVVLGCTGGNSPSLTNDKGSACLSVGPTSFAGVASVTYWSRSAIEGNPSFAWDAYLVDGGVSGGVLKGVTLRVWPVRGGPR
jgi:hypothetical protein